MIDGLSNNELILRLDVTHFHTCDIWLAVYLQATTEKLGVYHIHAGLQTVRHSILSTLMSLNYSQKWTTELRKFLCTWFGEVSSCCCLSLLPQLACNILGTTYKEIFSALNVPYMVSLIECTELTPAPFNRTRNSISLNTAL